MEEKRRKAITLNTGTNNLKKDIVNLPCIIHPVLCEIGVWLVLFPYVWSFQFPMVQAMYKHFGQFTHFLPFLKTNHQYAYATEQRFCYKLSTFCTREPYLKITKLVIPLLMLNFSKGGDPKGPSTTGFVICKIHFRKS